MVSRRTVVGAGVVGAATVVVGAAATDRLDDILRGVGFEPKPESDGGDRRIAARARADARALLDLARAEKASKSVTSALTEHLRALGTGTASAPAADLPDRLSEACRTVAATRARDAGRAVSVDLAQVLGSMAAGLDQCRLSIEAG